MQVKTKMLVAITIAFAFGFGLNNYATAVINDSNNVNVCYNKKSKTSFRIAAICKKSETSLSLVPADVSLVDPESIDVSKVATNSDTVEAVDTADVRVSDLTVNSVRSFSTKYFVPENFGFDTDGNDAASIAAHTIYLDQCPSYAPIMTGSQVYTNSDNYLVETSGSSFFIKDSGDSTDAAVVAAGEGGYMRVVSFAPNTGFPKNGPLEFYHIFQCGGYLVPE